MANTMCNVRMPEEMSHEHGGIASHEPTVEMIVAAVRDNPDLPEDFIKETMISRAMDKSLAVPFRPS